MSIRASVLNWIQSLYTWSTAVMSYAFYKNWTIAQNWRLDCGMWLRYSHKSYEAQQAYSMGIGVLMAETKT